MKHAGYGHLMIIPLFLLLSLMFMPAANAQKQLILLKKEKILLRLFPGDEIVYKTKTSDVKVTSYVNNLFDTALMAHKTMVPFHQIERLYFAHSNHLNLIGKFLFAGGIAYFVVDQLNVIVLHGDKPRLDESVTTTSVVMVAAGLPLMLIKRKSQRMKRGYRLMTVEPDSPFYMRGLNY